MAGDRSFLAFWVASTALLWFPGGLHAEEPDYRQLGHEHYFNLEYDKAIAAYRRVLEKSPGDANVHNHIATSILFKELHRLGMLESSAFKGDNKFLKQEKPKPDPKVRAEFKKTLAEGRRLALSVLKEFPGDPMALYALSNSYGLEANYQFMVDKSYFAALRNGGRANKLSKRLRTQHPDFVDAHLILGIHQYVLGSLPWPVKVLIALGGMRGDKKKGERWVRRVSNEGKLARHEARVLLAILLRRERHPLEAATILEGLGQDFPRNYVFRLELGAMYQDAGDQERALAVFREILALHARNAPGYGRMPQRVVDALDRKIEEIENKNSELLLPRD